MMLYKIKHTTEYIYNEPISLCHNVAKLIPRNTSLQQIRNPEIKVEPLPDVWNEYEDFFGNKVIYFAIQREHKKLHVSVVSEVLKLENKVLQFNLYNQQSWEQVSMQLRQINPEFIETRQFIPETVMTKIDEAVRSYARLSFTPGRPALEAVQDLMNRIYADFTYKPGFTTISTPVAEVIKQKKGVCQDFAHLAIACIRSVGLPARYVSGYIETIPPPGTQKLTGSDASHAWCSVYFPDTGWIDFDPTNNQFSSEQHITIGWGRDYADITPLKGVILSSGHHKLSVSVDVKRIT